MCLSIHTPRASIQKMIFANIKVYAALICAVEKTQQRQQLSVFKNLRA